MPPHLHPRSNATSTLFAGTLIASFVVVGIPHIFPCPRPRRGYADSDRQLDPEGRPRKRKKPSSPSSGTQHGLESGGADFSDVAVFPVKEDPALKEQAAIFRQLEKETQLLEREARECPIPKPKGILGDLLGFAGGRRKPNERKPSDQ